MSSGERPVADGHLQRRLRRALCHASCCCTGTRCGSAHRLNLTALDVFDARASVRRHGISVALGLSSIAIAALLPPQHYLAFAGLHVFPHGAGARHVRLFQRPGARAPPEVTLTTELGGPRWRRFWDPAIRDDICRRVGRLDARDQGAVGQILGGADGRAPQRRDADGDRRPRGRAEEAADPLLPAEAADSLRPAVPQRRADRAGIARTMRWPPT